MMERLIWNLNMNIQKENLKKHSIFLQDLKTMLQLIVKFNNIG